MHTPEDLKATELRLDDLFVKDCDTYAAGAAFVFEKPLADVTRTERALFKMAFIRAFHLRAPALITSMFDYSDRLIVELQKRGIFNDVDRAISERWVADETGTSTP
jgi:hypothetical protein